MAFKDNPIVYLTKKLWVFSKGNRSKVVLFVILFLMANIADFFWPLIIGKILNIIQTQGINPENFWTIVKYLLIFPVLTVVFWAFHGPARVMELKNAFLVEANYRQYLLKGTMSLPADWHTDHHSGDTIDRVNKSTESMWSYSSHFFEVIETVVRFLGSYFALVYFNVHAAYIVLIMVILTLSLIIKFDKVLVKNYTKLFVMENKISARIFDTLSNITTVIILRIEKLALKVIKTDILTPLNLFHKTNKISETKWFLVAVCSSLMTFFVMFSYVYASLKNIGVMVGTIFILYEYVHRINGLFFRFAYKYSQIVRQKTAVLNGEEIAEEFEKITSVKISKDKNLNWKKLKIADLSFSYHSKNSGDLHLDKVNMDITRGEKIALVGESGSGKTTFLKVIRELYTPRYVNLYIDGNISKTGFKEISKEIALIPQDPEIFNSTIKENITFGARVHMNEIHNVCNISEFSGVVSKLPKKFNSSIVEKGVNLSGGQKQRLALARGILASKDKSIVLLDEPTSSVDSVNELKIYKNIFKKFKKKTIISSIHRLHLLPLFDTIYLFENGKVVDFGSFEELKKRSKSFKNMLKKYDVSNKTKK